MRFGRISISGATAVLPSARRSTRLGLLPLVGEEVAEPLPPNHTVRGVMQLQRLDALLAEEVAVMKVDTEVSVLCILGTNKK